MHGQGPGGRTWQGLPRTRWTRTTGGSNGSQISHTSWHSSKGYYVPSAVLRTLQVLALSIFSWSSDTGSVVILVSRQSNRSLG